MSGPPSSDGAVVEGKVSSDIVGHVITTASGLKVFVLKMEVNSASVLVRLLLGGDCTHHLVTPEDNDALIE